MLNVVEVRVLGSLVEKEMATPEYYPLTLNALVNACNQKSNRDPAVSYDEDTVADAIDSLREKGMAASITGAGMRVPKFRERLSEKLNLGRRELAILCELMVRGPQTVGELRDRAGRLHPFSDTEEVESVLERLIEWQPEPLAVRLPRQPGMKEPRTAHLLAGPPAIASPAAEVEAEVPRVGRLAELEAEVRALREEVRVLAERLEKFRAQFE
ncbi:MAG TPA: YceH family protein [Bryobacteraceae bacterium]|nr:YceH family protein [Bryobacteraceae bacterium]